MTHLLEQAVETARELPSDMQDEIARLILRLAGREEEPVDISDEDEAAVLASREAAARNEFASEEHMHAIWAKYGL